MGDIDRLVTAREIFPHTMHVRERQRRQRDLNEFTGKLLCEAMTLRLCSAADALSAVYLSGLLHGALLGPRSFEKEPGWHDRPLPPFPRPGRPVEPS